MPGGAPGRHEPRFDYRPAELRENCGEIEAAGRRMAADLAREAKLLEQEETEKVPGAMEQTKLPFDPSRGGV